MGTSFIRATVLLSLLSATVSFLYCALTTCSLFSALCSPLSALCNHGVWHILHILQQHRTHITTLNPPLLA